MKRIHHMKKDQIMIQSITLKTSFHAQERFDSLSLDIGPPTGAREYPEILPPNRVMNTNIRAYRAPHYLAMLLAVLGPLVQYIHCTGLDL